MFPAEDPMWNKVIEKLREERCNEFAPPKAYDKKTKNKHDNPKAGQKKPKVEVESSQSEREKEPETQPPGNTQQNSATNFNIQSTPTMPEFLQKPHLLPPEFFSSIPPPNIILPNAAHFFQASSSYTFVDLPLPSDH
jgi:hypothetical protein